VGVFDVGDDVLADVRASYGNFAHFGSCWDEMRLRDVTDFVARSRCGGFVVKRAASSDSPLRCGDAEFIRRVMSLNAMMGVVMWQDDALVVPLTPELKGQEVAEFAATSFGVAAFVVKGAADGVTIKGRIKLIDPAQMTFRCVPLT
jgi:hypothetical protein